MKLLRKRKRRLNRPYKDGLSPPIFPNVTRSIDFMSDSLEDCRKVTILNIMDDYNRECMTIENGVSICSHRVTKVLDWVIELSNGHEYKHITIAIGLKKGK